MVRPVINAPEIATTREQQLFNGKNFHVLIYNKTESISGSHQHGYYESTLVLTKRYFQEINDKRVLPERGDFVFIPLGSYHQSFYELDATRILSTGINKRFFEQRHPPLLPYRFVASQVYRINNAFLTYVETVIPLLNFRKAGLEEFVETVTFYVINRLRHYRKEWVINDVPQRPKSTVEKMHDKEQFSESALENMVALLAKSQGYLTQATRRYYDKASMQIISETCINFAKKRPEMANYSVTDIVLETGYNSPSLFTKTFKRLASFTPKGYCKKLTKFNQQVVILDNSHICSVAGLFMSGGADMPDISILYRREKL